MSGNTPHSTPTSLEELRELREQFTKAHASAEEKLTEVNKQIKSLEHEEWKQKRADALKQILPEGDKETLKGHEIHFLINNTKEGGHGPDSPLGAAVAAAYKVYALVLEANVKDASVSTRFWGGKKIDTMKLDTKFGAKAYNTAPSSEKNFLPAAKDILASNTPDTVSEGKHKNYVIICDGAVDGDVDHAASILAAAAKFNPQATFDFVVYNAGETKVDALVQKWSETASGQAPNLIKVGALKDIHGAVLNAVKARLSGDVYKPSAPASKTAGPAAQPSP